MTTDKGEIFAGHKDAADAWTWTLEDANAAGDLISVVSPYKGRFRAISVDAAGQGFAVGDGGLVLQRDGDGAHPWRRLVTGYGSNFWSLAVSPAGPAGGALIGGEAGLILTYTGGRFATARQDDLYDPINLGWPGTHGRVLGVSLIAGTQPGQVEAWAAEQNQPTSSGLRDPAPGALLHYASDGDPLLNPAGRARPLPDTPAGAPGELVFAAFGKQECRYAQPGGCLEPVDSGLANEVIAHRVADAILAQSKLSGGPGFALFTGDASDSGAHQPAGAGGSPKSGEPDPFGGGVADRRWIEQTATRFADAGLPLYGALGGLDLSTPISAPAASALRASARAADHVAPTTGWRSAFSVMPAPWGAVGQNPPADAHGLSYAPVADAGVEAPPLATPAVNAPGAPAGVDAVPVSGASAHTHYAVDLVRGGQKLLRLVVADSSLKSLSAADAQQNPAEPSGGQLAWLRSVLCVAGEGASAPGDRCRDAGERAVLVSETPTYSYGPGASSDTATDATVP